MTFTNDRARAAYRRGPSPPTGRLAAAVILPAATAEQLRALLAAGVIVGASALTI